MKRVQRKRTKGYRMPENTKYVGRPTAWGNPFKLTPDGWIMYYSVNRKILDPWIYWSVTGGFCLTDIVELYECWIKGEFKNYTDLPNTTDIEQLKGFDLACFCPLNSPCHADILIKLLSDENT